MFDCLPDGHLWGSPWPLCVFLWTMMQFVKLLTADLKRTRWLGWILDYIQNSRFCNIIWECRWPMSSPLTWKTKTNNSLNSKKRLPILYDLKFIGMNLGWLSNVAFSNWSLAMEVASLHCIVLMLAWCSIRYLKTGGEELSTFRLVVGTTVHVYIQTYAWIEKLNLCRKPSILLSSDTMQNMYW